MTAERPAQPESSRALHPIAVAVFPILAIYSANVREAPVVDLVRPLLAALAIACVVWGAFALVLRDRNRAALAATWTLCMFWACLLVRDGLIDMTGVRIGNREFIAAWGLVYLVGLWRIRRTGRGVPRLTKLLNATAAALLAVPLYAAFGGPGERGEVRASTEQTAPIVTLAPDGPTDRPDVYWIVLDAYGRSDMLRREGFPVVSTLGDTLPSLGFYVADESRSNYATTIHSLASAANLGYLHELLPDADADATDREPIRRLLAHSVIRRTLAERGYRFVAYSTGYYPTELPDADLYVLPWGSLSEFESAVINATVLRTFAARESADEHRKRVEHCFATLPDFADNGRPDFVFVHMVVPHHPFVFNADGTDAPPGDLPFTFGVEGWYRGVDQPGDRVDPDYAAGYAAQLAHVNAIVERTVRQIIARSTTPPIIIIQGDHGPGGWNLRPARARFAILNAYYLPGGDTGSLYPSISPVNTFRVVLNRCFGADLPLLPDERRWSSYGQPYQWPMSTGDDHDAFGKLAP